MSRILLLSLLLISCGTTQSITCPTCPICTTCPPPTTITKVDSVPYPVYILQDNPVTLSVSIDSATPGTIWLSPSLLGDDTKQLQDAINWNIDHPGTKVMLRSDRGPFTITAPLLAISIQNGNYGQVQIDIEGNTFARNSVAAAQIICNFTDGFGIGIMKGKGCKIINILGTGTYHFPDNQTPVSIDTMSVSAWPHHSRTNPYAFICIDWASKKNNGEYKFNDSNYQMYKGYEGYYLDSSDNGGSTSIMMEGLEIENFEVGIMNGPAMQANGEEIVLNHSRIDYCRTAYAYSQAQSKNNWIIDLMSWGNLYDVEDGLNYGFFRSDGSCAPFTDGANLAGYIHEFFEVSAQAFPVSISRVYAESLYKIGFVYYGSAGIHFTDCQFHMQSEYPNVPSPDFYYWGTNTTWSGGCIRQFNGVPTMRIPMNSYDNVFRDITFSSYPVLSQLYNYPQPRLDHSNLYNVYPEKIVDGNNYDSLVSMPGTTFNVDLWDYTGYLLSPQAQQVAIGDLMVYGGNFKDEPYQGAYMPAGYATRVSADTVFLMNIGQGIHTGDSRDIFDCKIKQQTK